MKSESTLDRPPDKSYVFVNLLGSILHLCMILKWIILKLMLETMIIGHLRAFPILACSLLIFKDEISGFPEINWICACDILI